MHLSKKLKTAVSLILLDELTTTLLSPLPNLTIISLVDEIFLNTPFIPILFKEEHQRMNLFFEEWIDKYLDYDFYTRFRMSRLTCDLLINELAKSQIKGKSHSGGRAEVPLEKAVLITLWYLCKGETLISISDRFDVALSTTHGVIKNVVQAILAIKNKYIIWPTEQECRTISGEFFDVCGYPGVIGAIDGCHINCKVPVHQHDSYQDRKLNHSIALQGICTATNIFTHISVGYPGSIHDACILRESALGRLIESEGYLKYFYTNDYHLIGDSAYPLKTWLMKPFRDSSTLTAQQKGHNNALSTGRVCIENVFGLLKGRWRVLRYVNVYNVVNAVDIIASCCILHNFCFKQNDKFDSLNDNNPPVTRYGTEEPDREGVEKRNRLCQLF